MGVELDGWSSRLPSKLRVDMPVYEYKCECGVAKEAILDYEERNEPQAQTCGSTMQRKVSLPAKAIIPETGKDKVLSTLNQEKGYKFPGDDKHRPRYEQAMGSGLTYERPLEEKVFQGFG